MEIPTVLAGIQVEDVPAIAGQALRNASLFTLCQRSWVRRNV